MPPVYFVQHLAGHDERLLGMDTGRIDLAHPAVCRILADLQPLDRIDLRACRFDCQASLAQALRRRIRDAEDAAQGWRMFDEHGVLRCKRFPGDAQVIVPHGLPRDDEWLRLLMATAAEASG
ncbi:hypothetical protein [Stenotrophomonas sp.]|uniref:hypothetical protein n=1 Tax=Stenotrophomonas sp. TaxID=69392 RepID=UPI0028B22853|nr:hypothetical protein [Stenotrophomonas sp.]